MKISELMGKKKSMTFGFKNGEQMTFTKVDEGKNKGKMTVQKIKKEKKKEVDK